VVGSSSSGDNHHDDDTGTRTTTAQDIRNAVQEAQLSFPIIVKPLTAAGTKASHSMAVVMHPSGLEQITDRVPCLLQEYVNHNSVLYKVYVLGDFVSVHKRRSLPNLPTTNTSSNTTTTATAVVEFDSQRPYPRLRDFGYLEDCCNIINNNNNNNVGPTNEGPGTTSITLSPEGKNAGGFVDTTTTATPAAAANAKSSTIVTAEEVRPIVNSLKTAFGLEIFGFDVLITDNDEMLVVDVNYFPSYKEVPNFPALLAKYLTGKAIARRLEQRNNLNHSNRNNSNNTTPTTTGGQGGINSFEQEQEWVQK
jgi:inositol-1,3,4-trisphosphate 5/6-kinase/inositol-tetrakisphosphate 1-kinase